MGWSHFKFTSPGWMHETSARTWCNGKTKSERVEREVGGGIGMGNTCKPMAVSFQYMTKSTTKKKKKFTITTTNLRATLSEANQLHTTFQFIFFYQSLR